MATERPEFDVLLSDDEFQLREYQPMLLAQTVLTDEQAPSSNRAFNVLADFIFGNNTAPKFSNAENISSSGDSNKNDLNKEDESTSSSLKIAMTAPVLSEKSLKKMQMAFVLPSHFNEKTVPKPNNKNIELKKTPRQKFAVISFSGFTKDKKVAKKTEKLRDWMQKNNLVAGGNPKLARYDAPWVLPMLRENEIWIRIKE